MKRPIALSKLPSESRGLCNPRLLLYTGHELKTWVETHEKPVIRAHGKAVCFWVAGFLLFIQHGEWMFVAMMQLRRRLRSTISLMICPVLLAACAGAGPKSGADSDTAPPPPVATAQPKKEADYSAQYPKLWGISEPGPAIPGLADGMIPQGLAHWHEKNRLIISNYVESGGASTLMVVDAKTQALVKRVNLYEEDGAAYTGHAGGVAVSAQHVWIASDGYAYRIPLKELAGASDNGKLKLTDRFPTPTRASYATYAEGILWVGEFYSLPDYPTDKSHRLTNNEKTTYNAWAVGYVLDPKTDRLPEGRVPASGDAVPDYILSTADKIQGMAVTGDSIILSQSFGRTKDSLLLKYEKPDLKGEPHQRVKLGGKDVPVWFLDRKNIAKNAGSLTVPPMSEGIITDGQNRLYVLFESGASKYRPTALSPMDRLRVIRLDDWNRSSN